jgi:hypothetical protein
VHDVEAEHVVPERERTRDFRDLQVDVPDVDSRVDAHPHDVTVRRPP